MILDQCRKCRSWIEDGRGHHVCPRPWLAALAEYADDDEQPGDGDEVDVVVVGETGARCFTITASYSVTYTARVTS